MRSVGFIVTAAVAVSIGGCDVVFGLSHDRDPCDATSFATATPKDLATAQDFSVSWDRSFAVVSGDLGAFEVTLADGTTTPIDLGIYNMSGLAMAPEGTSMFFTAVVEPPSLQGALRAGAASWVTTTARLPAGTFAGTPTADEFGPRRVLVRLRDATDQIQEYEDDDGLWKPHGDVHEVGAMFAPNLTPNGLSMVFAGTDPTTLEPAVFLATRASIDDWFGDPIAILPGPHRSPQLLDTCKALYVVDDPETLREYDRS
jgi:hypothetical protein